MDLIKSDLVRDLFKNRKYPEALQVANDVLATNATDLEALWIIASCYFELGDDASAERNLRNYLKFDTQNVDGIHRLSVCLKRQQRVAEAMEYLNHRSNQIESALLSSELASLYLDQGDSDLAILHGNRALQLEPDNAQAHIVLGATFILLGTPKEAIKHLSIAQQQTPANPQLYINLAAAYELLGDGEKQLEALNLALQCDSSLQGLYPLIGDLCLRQQKTGQAIEAFSKYLLFDAKSLDANLGLARAQQLSGEHELAKKTYLNLVREQPEQIIAWIELGQLFELTNDIEKAATCFQQVLEVDKDHTMARDFFQRSEASRS